MEMVLEDRLSLYPLLEKLWVLADSYRSERSGEVEEDVRKCLFEITFLLESYRDQFPFSVRSYFDAFLEEDLDVPDRLAALDEVLRFLEPDSKQSLFFGFSQSENLKRWIRFFHDARHGSSEGDAHLLLKGMGIGFGKASGRVFVIQSNHDYLNIPENSVVVARTTRPDLIISIEKVAAIVTEIGGRFCHASIIARQMGVPCVVNCPTATDILENGMWVTVDAEQGGVFRARRLSSFS